MKHLNLLTIVSLSLMIGLSACTKGKKPITKVPKGEKPAVTAQSTVTPANVGYGISLFLSDTLTVSDDVIKGSVVTESGSLEDFGFDMTLDMQDVQVDTTVHIYNEDTETLESIYLHLQCIDEDCQYLVIGGETYSNDQISFQFASVYFKGSMPNSSTYAYVDGEWITDVSNGTANSWSDLFDTVKSEYLNAQSQNQH